MAANPAVQEMNMATKIFSNGKKSKSQTESSPIALSIDYPQEGDVVLEGHYAVRISVPFAGQTQVSVNKGPWQTCRPDSGYQWFDWWPEKSGKQKLEARLVLDDGTILKAEVRSFTVKSESSN